VRVPTTRVHTQDLGTNSVATSDIQSAAVTFSKLALAASNPCIEDDGAGNSQVKVDASSVVRSAAGLAVGLKAGGGLEIATGLGVRGAKIVSADPAGPAAGDLWYNSSSGLFKLNPVTVAGVLLPSAINTTFWSGTNSNVITNTTVPTTFTPFVSIPAGFFNIVGRTVRITAILGGSGPGAETFTLSLRWNGGVIWSRTFTANQMGNIWIEILMTTTATGVTGSLLCIGKTFNAVVAYTAANFATTVDLTVAGGLAFAGQWSIASVSDAAQLSYWSAELLG
jgi:hypothetical protein